MPETLTFKIVYQYEESEEGIAIPVTLGSASGLYHASAKVDPGAEVCLFSNSELRVKWLFARDIINISEVTT